MSKFELSISTASNITSSPKDLVLHPLLLEPTKKIMQQQRQAKKPHNPMKGVLFMVLAQFCLAFADALTKILFIHFPQLHLF